MSDAQEALADEYQRDTEKVNPGDNVGVVVFVPADPDMLYFSYWDLRKERDLHSQFQKQEYDVTLFMDNNQRLKKYDIVWKHTARSEAPLSTFVFLRWQKGILLVWVDMSLGFKLFSTFNNLRMRPRIPREVVLQLE